MNYSPNISLRSSVTSVDKIFWKPLISFKRAVISASIIPAKPLASGHAQIGGLLFFINHICTPCFFYNQGNFNTSITAAPLLCMRNSVGFFIWDLISLETIYILFQLITPHWISSACRTSGGVIFLIPMETFAYDK